MKPIETRSIGRGQKLMTTGNAIDKTSAPGLGDSSLARHGRALAGSVNDLSHSLTGASAAGPAAKKANRFS